MKHTLLLALFVFVSATLLAEDAAKETKTNADISGHVLSNGVHLPFVHVLIKGTTIGTVSDESGHFQLKNLPIGDHTVIFSALGYKSHETDIEAVPRKNLELHISLEEDLLGLDEVVITGNRNEEKRIESTVIINTLNAKTFNVTQSCDLKEGLNYSPGLRTENNCGNCGFSQVRMNGMEGPYSQILINSRPIFSGLAGVYGLELIPSNMIERVEIIRGGGSALYGSNAIAGTINLILKDPVNNAYEFNASIGLVGLGLDGSGEPAADHNLSFNTSLVTDDTKTGMAVYGNYRTRDPFDANNDTYSQLVSVDNTTIGTRLFHRFGHRSKLALDFFHINEARRGGDKFDSPMHETNITEAVDHKITTSALSYDQFFRTTDVLSVYASAQGVDRGSYYGAEQSLKDYGHTNDLTYNVGAQYKALFGKSNLLFGLENRGGGLKDKKLGYPDVENAVIVDGIIDSIPHTDNTMVADQFTNTMGAFAQYEIKWLRFTASAGLRYDHYLISDNLAPDSINGTINGDVFSPRINLKYDLTKTIQARASYSQGYRAPQIFDEDLHIETSGSRQVIHINDPNLVQETSHSFMLSLNYNRQFQQSSLSVLLEGFYTRLDNPFVNVTSDPDKNGVVTSTRTNAEGAAVQGLNLELNYIPLSSLTLNAGFTAQTSEYNTPQEDFNEKRFFRTPNTYGYFTLNWNATQRLAFAATGNYTDKMLVPHFGLDPETTDPDEQQAIANGDVIAGERLETSDPFFDFGAKVSYTVPFNHSKMQVYAGVKNLFNSYQNDFDRGLYRDPGYVYGPGLPRSITVGIKIGNGLF